MGTLLHYQNENKTVECVSCGGTMRGVLSHRARRVCSPCGGQALIKRPERNVEETVKIKYRTTPLVAKAR